MSLKDFTPAQAAAWIAQELRSSVNRGDTKQHAQDLKAELELFDGALGAKFPRSLQARRDLIAQLEAL